MNPLRTAAAASILGSFLVYGTATSLIPNRAMRLTARLRMNRRLARSMNRAIGLRIRDTPSLARTGDSRAGTGRVILANHTSVLDVLAIAAVTEAVFVTSRDMAESPPIRWLATIGGAAFVERRNREGRTAELAELEARLREGRTVVLFPEGTSTDGGGILRFRNGLLPAALRVPGTEIVPLCLQYRNVGGIPVDAGNRDRIFLYGEMSVAAHLLRIFTNPEVTLELREFAPFPAGDFGDAAAIAAHAETLVRSIYRPVEDEERPLGEKVPPEIRRGGEEPGQARRA